MRRDARAPAVDKAVFGGGGDQIVSHPHVGNHTLKIVFLGDGKDASYDATHQAENQQTRRLESV